jgi:N-methylhydantoinase B
MARVRLAELPMGEFYAEDYLDEGFTSKDPLKVCVRVKITKDEFLADFTGNPESPRASVNTTYPATFAAVGTIFLAITNPRVPFNQGLMRPIKVVCPENTIFNAKRPRPVSVYWETMTYAEDLVWKALAPHIPDKMSAGHFLSICSEIIAGTDPRSGGFFVLVEPNPGGWGAANNADGESALMNIADGETYTNPVEVLEIRYPVIVEKHKLNVEAGSGAGKFRGGVGLIKDYKVLADDAVFTTAVNRSKIPPWGVEGGRNGAVNSMVLFRDGKELMQVSRIFGYKLNRGDVLSIRSGGGGGWGNPLERKSELVLSDVHNRMITRETAEEAYRVVIDTSRWVVDETATARLRAHNSAHPITS